MESGKLLNEINVCSPQLGLNPKSILGGEVFDREILLGLAKNGVKLHIVLPLKKSHDKRINNWKVYYLKLKRFPAIFGNLIYTPYLFKIYRKSKFQILRIHQPQFLGIGCIIFKLFNSNVKLIATYHQFRETNFLLASRFINNYWDHIICDSLNVKKLLMRKYRVPESRITVVHNGVPLYLKPGKKDKKMQLKYNLTGKFVLLFMGVFTSRKNPIFLLDVLYNIKKTHKNVVILYWGEGPLKSQIIERAKELDIANNIRLIEPKHGEAKNLIHNLADLFVHPSLDEGFALAPLEAMSCSKPIIMNRTHSAKEAVDNNKNGYLCKVGDTGEWVDKIIKLKSNHNLLVKMSKYSKRKAEQEFNWNTSVNMHLEVFKRLTA